MESPQGAGPSGPEWPLVSNFRSFDRTFRRDPPSRIHSFCARRGRHVARSRGPTGFQSDQAEFAGARAVRARVFRALTTFSHAHTVQHRKVPNATKARTPEIALRSSGALCGLCRIRYPRPFRRRCSSRIAQFTANNRSEMRRAKLTSRGLRPFYNGSFLLMDDYRRN